LGRRVSVATRAPPGQAPAVQRPALVEDDAPQNVRLPGLAGEADVCPVSVKGNQAAFDTLTRGVRENHAVAGAEGGEEDGELRGFLSRPCGTYSFGRSHRPLRALRPLGSGRDRLLRGPGPRVFPLPGWAERHVKDADAAPHGFRLAHGEVSLFSGCPV